MLYYKYILILTSGFDRDSVTCRFHASAEAKSAQILTACAFETASRTLYIATRVFFL